MHPLIDSPTLNAITQIVILVGTILAIVKPFTARWPSVYSGISRVVRAIPSSDPAGAIMDDHSPPAPKLLRSCGLVADAGGASCADVVPAKGAES